MKYIIV